MIRRALISVSNKDKLEQLGNMLKKHGVSILSSGGTATHLRKHGIEVEDVSDFTKAPEMLNGRLKTLHPKVHGGILAVRNNSDHMSQMEERGYVPIDLVVVNLYPFEECQEIEQIDIGGPTMLRAAAKNYTDVTVLIDPNQYDELEKELDHGKGETSLEFRKAAARKVFERTAVYDAAIAQYFQRDLQEIPTTFSLGLKRKWEMRYGENPHQNAGFYLQSTAGGQSVIDQVLQGKQLSYNNLLDVHAALDLITEFDTPFAVGIFKHTNPCGVGISTNSLHEAYDRALACDPVSAFGGIVVFSKEVDEETAQHCTKTFTEIVIGPGFRDGARKIFEKKKNLRLVQVDLEVAKNKMGGLDIRRAVDGYLVQERDRTSQNIRTSEVVTKRQPTEEEWVGLALAWKVAKHVKSNAIVLAHGNGSIGIGAGQMSRVDSSRFAVLKADKDKVSGSVLASDAFFPFRDGVDEAAKNGVTAVIQPGGSMRDKEVIEAANEHDLAMVFTGTRHFKH